MSSGDASFTSLPSDQRASVSAAPTATRPAPRAGASRTKSPTSRRPNAAANGHERTPDYAALIARMRDEACERYKPQVRGAAPIRVMARMVQELERTCIERGFPAEAIAAGIVNRTIGDVDLRHVSLRDDGPAFVTLADDMGLALPGEVIADSAATGDTYRWIHERMLDFERQLLARRFDLRMYDVSGIGNPLLREMLSAYALQHWGYTVPPECIHLSLGALDGLDKFFRGFATARRQAGEQEMAIVFPAPSFNVPEWQAQSLGLRLHRLYTQPEDSFKVTPEMLRAALDDAPDIRAFYLTVSNNPTAFAYTPAELRALFDTLTEANRGVLIVADLAYIGTGDPDEDRARMAEFNRPGVFERTVFVNSFSKTHTLTGDRCGWVGFGDPALAAQVGAGWTNSTASLPAEWQLRYMAYIELFNQRPALEERIRALYRHRRERLIKQLHALDAQHHVFAHVNLDDGGTVYNWSQLCPGEDVFTFFSKTGIAGVPGSGFGYSDDFLRLSVGCIPIPEV
ncbi:MAG: Aspartate aminotransferase [Ktedonobacterales bacterium]|nr:MAG: Aspartate aminotransferase [Ktedonobacterales bacterium]